MSVELYSIMAYALTAGIALVMIGCVVVLNKIMSSGSNSGEGSN